MSETLFIADLHLPPYPSALSQMAIDFFQHRASQAEAVYILGDLFEVWLGDDDDTPIYQTILMQLRQLTAQGISVTVLHGNRDFLLGQGFAQRTGCILVEEDSLVIDLYNIPVLLMHGDTLCTLDTDYQAFRQQTRHPAWQQQFLAKPLNQRWQLAQQARAQSQAQTQNLSTLIMDVTFEAVVDTLKARDIFYLIHGHTHRPAIHEFSLIGQKAYRYVVGDWHIAQAIILSCTAEKWQLVDLKQF